MTSTTPEADRLAALADNLRVKYGHQLESDLPPLHADSPPVLKTKYDALQAALDAYDRAKIAVVEAEGNVNVAKETELDQVRAAIRADEDPNAVADLTGEAERRLRRSIQTQIALAEAATRAQQDLLRACAEHQDEMLALIGPDVEIARKIAQRTRANYEGAMAQLRRLEDDALWWSMQKANGNSRPVPYSQVQGEAALRHRDAQRAAFAHGAKWGKGEDLQGNNPFGKPDDDLADFEPPLGPDGAVVG